MPFNIFGYTTCITECPNTTTEALVCSEQDKCNTKTFARYVTDEVMGYCVPVKDSLPAVVKTNFAEGMQKFFSSVGGAPIYDIYKARWILIYSVGIAIIYAFVYIKFMDWCAYQCAWLSVITVQIALVAGGYVCFALRHDMLEAKTI